MSFNAYQEAKDWFSGLLDRYDGNDKAAIMLTELVDATDAYGEYEYSVYNSTLFEALSDDLSILAYAQDVEREFGQGIASNPLSINTAIERYILEEYGDKDADYFDIEVEEEEEDDDDEDDDDGEEFEDEFDNAEFDDEDEDTDAATDPNKH